MTGQSERSAGMRAFLAAAEYPMFPEGKTPRPRGTALLRAVAARGVVCQGDLQPPIGQWIISADLRICDPAGACQRATGQSPERPGRWTSVNEKRG